MNETELLETISRKTSVPVATVRAVVDALLDEVREGHVSEDILRAEREASAHRPTSQHSDPRAVDDLIARARKHALGLEFLRDGYLGSVAAEFGTHAFTVEAARLLLRDQRRTEDAS
jgi:hypothetical protein